jgi:hypothetical protein
VTNPATEPAPSRGPRIAHGRRWAQLDRSERRRVAARILLQVLLAWSVLLLVYYLLPLTAQRHAGALARLVLAAAVFAAFLAWAVRRIARSAVPELRAVEALSVAIPLFIVLFAGVHLSLSSASPSDFSQPLDHTGSLYFTITTFSSVGFGDITARTDFARILVSLQMMLDLLLLGAIVRLLFNAARTGLEPMVSVALPRSSDAADT